MADLGPVFIQFVTQVLVLVYVGCSLVTHTQAGGIASAAPGTDDKFYPDPEEAAKEAAAQAAAKATAKYISQNATATNMDLIPTKKMTQTNIKQTAPAADTNWTSRGANANGTASGAPNKCDPREYVQRGYCQKYFTCNRKSREEIKRGCSDGLFWNPHVNSIHGGVCDYLRNIENSTLYEYKSDPSCTLDVAYFRASGDCSPKYFFNHPIRTHGKEEEETCPQGLLWSRTQESCELCDVVKKADGTPCCDTPPDDY